MTSAALPAWTRPPLHLAHYLGSSVQKTSVTSGHAPALHPPVAACPLERHPNSPPCLPGPACRLPELALSLFLLCPLQPPGPPGRLSTRQPHRCPRSSAFAVFFLWNTLPSGSPLALLVTSFESWSPSKGRPWPLPRFAPLHALLFVMARVST